MTATQSPAPHSRISEAKRMLPLPQLLVKICDGEAAKKSARCRIHKDNQASFSIFQTEDGAWLWKCHAGCGTGDGVDYLEKRFNLSTGDAIQRYLAEAGLSNGHAQPAPKTREAFNWLACVAAFGDEAKRQLAEWRGLSLEFADWLHGQKIVGLHSGNLALAVHDDSGKVIACHRLIDRDKKKWIYEPNGKGTHPLTFGDTRQAGFVLCFESQWDSFGIMDRLAWHLEDGLPDAAILVTRGAQNGKLIAEKCSRDAVVYAFPQNDRPDPKTGKIPSEEWLKSIAAHAGCKVLRVTTPTPHKDANDWTKAGATKEEIETAIHAAKLVDVPKVEIEAGSVCYRTRQILGEALVEIDRQPDMAGAIASIAAKGLAELGSNGQADDWSSLVDDGADIVTERLPDVVQVVEGIVAEQCKLVIGSGSKSFKTWLTLDLGFSIAHGALFLGRRTHRERVLYVNLELRPQAFKRRVQAVAKAKDICVDRDWFRHLPLRGKLAGLSVREIVNRIIALAKRFGARVVICDPVYKLNVEGDENSSRDQTRLFNELDRITTEAGCTLILNDHFSKGNQSEKDPLDAIRGSSAKGGDLDAAMILRRHEVEGCFRVDIIHRELPPVEPFVIGWEFPLMRLRPDLNAEAMKKSKAGRRKAHDPQALCAAISDSTSEKPVSISAWAKAAGTNRTTLNEYLPGLRAKGWIGTAGEGNNARQYVTEKGRLAIKREKGEA